MIQLAEIRLPYSAVHYLESLLDRIPGLYRDLMAEIRTGGHLSTILPEGTTLIRAEQYDAGGVTAAADTESWLLERLQNQARRGVSGIFMVQDFWFPPRDYARHPPRSDIWIDDGQVYLWTEVNVDRTEQLRQCLRSVKSFYFACFLVNDLALAQRLRTGSADIADLAAEVSNVYVPAYDGESFVIWSR